MRTLSLAALLLTLVVIVFGAYVRLSDAGLGCPDWPGCYGQISPAHAEDEITARHAADPHGWVSMPKAWKEMTHRYIASTLGVLIVALAVMAWRRWRKTGAVPWMAWALVGVVVFQGLLGKWTVTLLLKPAIVTSHLLGGMTVLACLMWMVLRERGVARLAVSRGMAWAARLALVLLVAQIALGGWVSTNYAAMACPDLPTCQAQWVPANMDFDHGFHLTRDLGHTADGDRLPFAALTAIHWTHRVGAVVVGLYLLVFGARLVAERALRGHGALLIGAVLAQIALGIANVLFSLPLALAVAHNAGAALLMMVVVGVNYRVGAAQGVRAMQTQRQGAWRERLPA
ncbi:MAG: COX15/CtaA family protein [Rhodocyclaceae bacterium]